MSLTMVPLGEIKTISMFRGKDEMKRRLQDLGFVKGQEVQVLGENASGLILMVKGTKIALNRGLASMIIVD
ncbi:MAG: ferrous iron transport protein A [Tissierella sp.]|nr:ferrous iron transport protein A [Tissierella sp.]